MSTDSEREVLLNQGENVVSLIKAKKELEKWTRQRGEEFVISKANLIGARVTGPNCNCHKKCMTYFTIEKNSNSHSLWWLS